LLRIATEADSSTDKAKSLEPRIEKLRTERAELEAKILQRAGRLQEYKYYQDAIDLCVQRADPLATKIRLLEIESDIRDYPRIIQAAAPKSSGKSLLELLKTFFQ
jgi:hypothetical protein